MKTVSKASLMHKKMPVFEDLDVFLAVLRAKAELTCSCQHTQHLALFSSTLSTLEGKTRGKLVWKNLQLKDFLCLDAEKHANDRSRWLSAGKKNGSEIKMGTWGNSLCMQSSRSKQAAFVSLSICRASTTRCLESLKCCGVSMSLNMYIISIYRCQQLSGTAESLVGILSCFIQFTYMLFLSYQLLHQLSYWVSHGPIEEKNLFGEQTCSLVVVGQDTLQV